MASPRYSPIWQLTLSRLKIFLREPAAIFWVYGFPIVMLVALGTAFRENPKELMKIDIVTPEAGEQSSSVRSLVSRLEDQRFDIAYSSPDQWQPRLQAGKTDLVIEPDSAGGYRLWDEPRRSESRIARYAVEAKLLRSALADESQAEKSQAALQPAEVKHLEKAGSRYIDFLLPGMLGLGLMGGGMWGVGFVIVDMRVRKLLKRFLATPMRRSDFLLAIMFSRLFFTLADIAILLFFGYLAFGVRSQGSVLDLTGAILLGAAAFAGIGLLVASRAETLETISGLMNLIMLPMWIFSGVFFSSERFPQVVQPVINLLPLTALNQLLRGIMLEGRSLLVFWPQAGLLAVYAAVTFTVALRVFRWR
jgi:ABC-type multidrug transport system permease subunit